MTETQTHSKKPQSEGKDSRFLIFRIGEETYGSPLLSVREVLEYQKPKFMPNMVKHFAGVINVRGAIVGVVDMRVKFGMKSSEEQRMAMLLCDTERGAVAAIVDQVESVLNIEDKDLDLDPPVQSKLGKEYLVGVAKNQNKLITIINLHKSLTDEEFKAP
jgi:purine-binding chemotaxis protein CheW